MARIHYVVICFQIVLYLGSYTTLLITPITDWVLWFAFKLFCTLVLTQLLIVLFYPAQCCDLLSNCFVPWFLHNFCSWLIRAIFVVICFQIVLYLGSYTTFAIASNSDLELWFAFKLFCTLVLTQRILAAFDLGAGCDLLSNCFVPWFLHNSCLTWSCPETVVICFQIVLYLGSYTTSPEVYVLPVRLWFAFKLFCTLVLTQPTAELD